MAKTDEKSKFVCIYQFKMKTGYRSNGHHFEKKSFKR